MNGLETTKTKKKNGNVFCIKIRPTIIKQHYNLFKYSIEGGDFIGGHTSLTTFLTFNLSKISVTPIFVCVNFYFFYMFLNYRS